MTEPTMYTFYILAEKGSYNKFVPLYEKYPFDLNYTGPILNRHGDDYPAGFRSRSFLAAVIGGNFDVTTLKLADFMFRHGAIPDVETWKMALSELLIDDPDDEDIWDEQVIYDVIDGFLRNGMPINNKFLELMKSNSKVSRLALEYPYIRSMDGIDLHIPEEVKDELKQEALNSAIPILQAGFDYFIVCKIIDEAIYNGASNYKHTCDQIKIMATKVSGIRYGPLETKLEEEPTILSKVPYIEEEKIKDEEYISTFGMADDEKEELTLRTKRFLNSYK